MMHYNNNEALLKLINRINKVGPWDTLYEEKQKYEKLIILLEKKNPGTTKRLNNILVSLLPLFLKETKIKAERNEITMRGVLFSNIFNHFSRMPKKPTSQKEFNQLLDDFLKDAFLIDYLSDGEFSFLLNIWKGRFSSNEESKGIIKDFSNFSAWHDDFIALTYNNSPSENFLDFSNKFLDFVKSSISKEILNDYNTKDTRVFDYFSSISDAANEKIQTSNLITYTPEINFLNYSYLISTAWWKFKFTFLLVVSIVIFLIFFKVILQILGIFMSIISKIYKFITNKLNNFFSFLFRSKKNDFFNDI